MKYKQNFGFTIRNQTILNSSLVSYNSIYIQNPMKQNKVVLVPL